MKKLAIAIEDAVEVARIDGLAVSVDMTLGVSDFGPRTQECAAIDHDGSADIRVHVFKESA